MMEKRTDKVDVRQLREALDELARDVAERLERVLLLHRLIRRPWAKPDGRAILADRRSDGFDDSEREPRTVLDGGAAPLVGALVRDRLEGLVEQVAAGVVCARGDPSAVGTFTHRTSVGED